ncbi:hypothetical protein [Isoptericola aurantiacus]|uniref:hypothetical protein n=1 Tax=Isoptericola aurantiacus TaxID=3377839 RepID=UPI00383B2686
MKLDLDAFDAAMRDSTRRVERVAAKRDDVVRTAEAWANGQASDGDLYSAVASLRAARRRARRAS